MDKNGNEIWLGLDVSTNCIGMCLFINDGTENGQLVKLTQIVPKVNSKIKGIHSLFEKKKIFKNVMLEEWADVKIDRVIIEEPLLRSNNINTVSTLLRFNGMISDCVYEIFNVVPDFISSYDARLYSFPELLAIRKVAKDGTAYDRKKIIKAIKDNNLVLFGSYQFDIDKKVVMMDKVNSKYPNIDWKLDKNEEIKKENFDACDSLVAVLGFKNKLKYNNVKGEIVDVEELDDKIKYTVNFLDKKYKKQIIF
jgi:hypothetical protein